MDLEAIRTHLHAAVDAMVDDLALAQAAVLAEPSVESGGPCEPFEYRRPDGVWEEYDPAAAFVANGSAPARDLVVGFTERPAWGALRGRAIVFDATGLPHAPDRWYPLVEFVQVDDGRFAAPLPNPARPRSYLRAGDELPARFRDSTVERLDALIASVRDGRSLRLVLASDERLEMARHGYWVASLRGLVKA